MMTKKEAMAMTDEQTRDALITRIREIPKGDLRRVAPFLRALAEVQDRIARKAK